MREVQHSWARMEFRNGLGREVIMLDKTEIRAAMKSRRKALTPAERAAASEIICAKLAARYKLPLRLFVESALGMDGQMT